MPTIDTPGHGQVSYATRGQGPAPLVLLHGWAGSGGYFSAFIDRLDPGLATCLSVDLPGHGTSTAPAGPYTLDTIADAVTAVADAAGADTMTLLGFSMSAKFAQYITSRHPDRVTGQALVAGCPTGPLTLPPEIVQDWCARAGNPQRLAEVITSCATRPIDRDILDSAGRAAAVVTKTVLHDTLDLVATASFIPTAHAKQVPTLVVGGSADWLFPPQVLEHGVADALTHAQLEILDCGHEVPIEDPDALAHLVSRFLTEDRTDGVTPAAAATPR